MTTAYCQYKNHRVESVAIGALYHYADPAHGIQHGVDICDDCLLEHVRRYYPGSPIERAILMHHPEWAAQQKAGEP